MINLPISWQELKFHYVKYHTDSTPPHPPLMHIHIEATAYANSQWWNPKVQNHYYTILPLDIILS
jgi:hypothetical protein